MITIKKAILFFVFISISAFTFSICRVNKDNNYYSYLTGYIHCQTKETCLHEASHKYDANNGMISKSSEWKQAIEDYRNTQYFVPDRFQDVIGYQIVFFPGIGSPRLPDKNIFYNSFWQGGWGGYTELYASIVEDAAGDINKIPVSLQKFYDMNEINKIMKGLGY